MEPRLTGQIATGLRWIIDVADSTRERLEPPAVGEKTLDSAEQALEYLEDLVQWHMHEKVCPRCQGGE